MTRPQATSCPNLNHRRSDAPVRYCPQCGGTVNSDHPIVPCTEDRHTAARRQQSTYCAHCGLRLIAARPGMEQNRGRGRAGTEDRWWD
jgi:hypothetical protein